MIKYRLEEDISAEDICIESDEYSLEYYSQVNNETKHFFGIPLHVFDGTKYFPVFGKKYINRNLSEKGTIPYSFIVDKTGTVYEFLRSLIYLKDEMKGFNYIEKAIALKKLYDIDRKVDIDTLELLEIPNNERHINGYLALASAPENIKELVLKERLHELTVFEIFQFDRQDWEKLAGFIAGIKLGTKKRNEILNMIYDIMKREGLKVREIVDSNEVREILGQKIDRLHIGQKLYNYFEDLWHPYISQYKKRFYSKLREVGIERYFRLKVPQNFENWLFEISFSFSSAHDFMRKVALLGDIGRTHSFHELMNLRS
jgi:hypothetical protein